MKTNFKQALMPLAVVVLGVVGAFASNSILKSNDASMDAYHYDITKPVGEKCVKVRVDCQNTGSIICTDLSGNQVWSSPIENNQLLTCSYQLFRQ